MPTTHATKSTADKGKAIAHELKQTYGDGAAAGFADNRPEAQALGSQIQLMRSSAQAQKLSTVQRMANGNAAPIQLVAKLTTPNPTLDEVLAWLQLAAAEGNEYYSEMAALYVGNLTKNPQPKMLIQAVSAINNFIDMATAAAAAPPAKPAAAAGAGAAAGSPAAAAAVHKPAAAAPVAAATPAATPAPLALGGAGGAAGAGLAPVAKAPAAAVHTPAAAAPAYTLKSAADVIAKLHAEGQKYLLMAAKPACFNTGYHGYTQPPRTEVVSQATLAAIVNDWKTDKAYETYFGKLGRREAYSFTDGHYTKKRMHDFLVDQGASPIFNFHIEVEGRVV